MTDEQDRTVEVTEEVAEPAYEVDENEDVEAPEPLIVEVDKLEGQTSFGGDE